MRRYLGEELARVSSRVEMVAFVRRLFSSYAANRAAYSYITTPIFYVNAAPHIGHLYTAVLADAAHRWAGLVGATPTILSTGTDEHGLKIQKAAETRGIPARVLCDRISGKFKNLFDEANIDYTDYIRTTEKRHVQTVNKFWNILKEGGHIYKGKYESWYSVPDEAFLSPSHVTNGMRRGTKVSMETGHVVEWMSEENYMFKLTSFRERLLEWIDSKPYPVVPELSRRLVRYWLQHETDSDLSVSRPRSRLSWGVPVPDDPSQTIYVWLDALVNYLTVSIAQSHSGCHSNTEEVCGEIWPATNQIVGKDILKFHAIYWPAFLMAAQLPLPRRIVSHAHWTVGSSKMSKSRGNVVEPHSMMTKYGVDPVRYFLLKEGSLRYDGDFSEERLVAKTNSDLPNTIGNLLMRISSTKLNPTGPKLQFHSEFFFTSSTSDCGSSRVGGEDMELFNSLTQLPEIVRTHYESFEFNKGIEAVMKTFHQTNHFIHRHAPWELVRNPDQHPWLQTVLSVVMETLRLSSILLYPVIPTSSREILKSINFEQDLNLKSGTALQFLLASPEGVKRFNETNCLSIGAPPIFSKNSNRFS